MFMFPFTPEYTANVDALGHLKILEAARKLNKKIKIYNASTSELFGSTSEKPQMKKHYLSQFLLIA